MSNQVNNIESDLLDEMFDYLDMVRETGQINMFGAAPWLEKQYKISRQDARAVLSAWMKSFGTR